MEETLSGGACVGDANGDGFDDLYYPRLDGSDILYLIDKNGNLDGFVKKEHHLKKRGLMQKLLKKMIAKKELSQF